MDPELAALFAELEARGWNDPEPQIPEELSDAVKAARWFSRIDAADESGDAERIDSEYATEYLEKQARIVAHNASSHLLRVLKDGTSHLGRYGEVNVAAKEIADPQLSELRKAAEVAGLDPNSADAALTIIVNGLIEAAYSKADRVSTINRAMLDLLLKGRVVCGWSNTDASLSTGVPVYC